MAANYLSLLMSSVNVTTSDDSDITNTHSTGQVDYLSHEWREEDVWHSWRRMTRQKNELSNGARLENASWRTWWKQRNGLQTVNPETLNWLKDSDVTWLYGPLHTAEDIRPALIHSSSAASAQVTRQSTPPPSPTQRPVDGSNPKPILKHRTVTELLISTLPPPGSTTGLVDVTSLQPEPEPFRPEGAFQQSALSDSSASSVRRPPLLHTKSETNIVGHSPFRKDSPPRIIAGDSPPNVRQDSDLARHSPSLSPTPHQDASGTRRHIAFNTFVEQCIAIDKPNPYADSTTSTTSFNSGRSSPRPAEPAQRGPYEYVHYSPRPSYQQAWRAAREDTQDSNSDDEDEDEQIEVKTRSRSSSIVSRPRPNMNLLDRDSRPSSRSDNRERVTIASIAPTLLKTSSHSHNASPAASSVSLSGSRSRATYCRPHESELQVEEESEEEEGDDGDVLLLWVPPVGSGYEREFSEADLDETSGYSYSTPPAREERGRDRDGRGWNVTPPRDEPIQDDNAEGRQGRFSRQRPETKRRGRGTRTSKLNGSLSPAEVPSTDSSESRSRSRNRTGLLPPRSSSRSRSRSSSAEQRSPSQSNRALPPEVTERQPTERGRPLVRKCDSDSDMRGDKTSRVGVVGGIHSQRAQTEAPPPVASRVVNSSNEGDKASHLPTSSSSSAGVASSCAASATTPTGPGGSSSSDQSPVNPASLSGIRGYIGSIWG